MKKKIKAKIGDRVKTKFRRYRNIITVEGTIKEIRTQSFGHRDYLISDGSVSEFWARNITK